MVGKTSWINRSSQILNQMVWSIFESIDPFTWSDLIGQFLPFFSLFKASHDLMDDKDFIPSLDWTRPYKMDRFNPNLYFNMNRLLTNLDIIMAKDVWQPKTHLKGDRVNELEVGSTFTYGGHWEW